jgi:hypothetical protein
MQELVAYLDEHRVYIADRHRRDRRHHLRQGFDLQGSAADREEGRECSEIASWGDGLPYLRTALLRPVAEAAAANTRCARSIDRASSGWCRPR